MTQVPQALVRRDQAFHVAPAVAVRGQRAARQHHLQDVQKLLGDFEVGLVASVMEGDQDLVRQPPAVARGPPRRRQACRRRRSRRQGGRGLRRLEHRLGERLLPGPLGRGRLYSVARFSKKLACSTAFSISSIHGSGLRSMW